MCMAEPHSGQLFPSSGPSQPVSSNAPQSGHSHSILMARILRCIRTRSHTCHSSDLLGSPASSQRPRLRQAPFRHSGRRPCLSQSEPSSFSSVSSVCRLIGSHPVNLRRWASVACRAILLQRAPYYLSLVAPWCKLSSQKESELTRRGVYSQGSETFCRRPCWGTLRRPRRHLSDSTGCVPPPSSLSPR